MNQQAKCSAHTYSRILLSLNKEENADTCYSTDDLEKIKLSEISHLQRTNSELPRIANSWIQDVEWWVPGVARRGELLFNGYRVSVL